MPPTWTNDNKSTDPTWQKYVRRGKTQTLGDLGGFRFTDPISEDGDPTLGDATIASFAESSQTWVNKSKS